MVQRIAIASLLLVASLVVCEASLVKMGFQKDKMPVEVESVLHTFERARRLQFFEMRELQTPDAETQVQEFDFEDSVVEIQPTETNHSETVQEFVEQVQSPPANETQAEFTQIQQGLDTHAIIDLGHNQTVALDMNQSAKEESPFFGKADTFAEDLTGVSSTPVAQFASAKEDVVAGRSSATGPRGGTADNAPKIDPTEIHFMIVRAYCFACNRAKRILAKTTPFVYDSLVTHLLISAFSVRLCCRSWKTFGIRAVSHPLIRLLLAPNSDSPVALSPISKNSAKPPEHVPSRVPSKRKCRTAIFTSRSTRTTMEALEPS